MIQFENVSFGYTKENQVLDGFSLEIPDGGRVCLFGKSGCGKSTVLRLAMGLSKPGRGRITGTEGLSISAVFQEDRLLPWKTVLENVAMFADALGGAITAAGNPAVGNATAILRALGLGDVLHSLPEELSGGMKRRVGLARALAHSFDLLVLDEPFTGLDDAAKKNAIALVNRVAGGKMLLLATHDREEAEALGAKIVEL